MSLVERLNNIKSSVDNLSMIANLDVKDIFQELDEAIKEANEPRCDYDCSFCRE